MRRVAVVVAACLAGLPGFAFAEEAAKPAAGAAAPPQLSADECAVWARELGFARALAEHDAAGFAAFLHPQAAFGAGRP